MIDDNKIKFTCPKCQAEFSLHDLLQHDTNAFNKYVEALVQEKTNVSLNKEIAVLKSQSNLELNQKLQVQEKELKNQHQIIEEEYRQELKNLEDNLTQEKSNLKILESIQQATIAQKVAEAQKDIAQKINDLELTIQEKTATIDSQKRELTERIKEIQTSDEIEYLNHKSALEETHRVVIGKVQAELIEEKNKLKVFESTRQLQIDTKVREAKDQYAQEIQNLQLIVQAKEFEMDQKVKDIIHIKEKEYQEQKTQLEAQHQEELFKLRTDLERNKVFSNKIKGENFEQEVENELRKAFQDRDRIEKITKTKGDTKADYLQVVKNVNNNEIGKIVYEVKHAEWSDAWLPKFATDVANNQTKYGILVATSFHDKYKGDISFIKSDEYENLWIADPWSFIFVAQVVRKIIEIENSFWEKEKQLTGTESSAVIKEYNDKILQLKNYVEFGFPEFLKTFKIQLRSLEGIETSLQNNAKKLTKTREILQKKFEKLVKNKLEEIVGQVIVESSHEENSESEFSSSFTPINEDNQSDLAN